jgi:hypothetical protein
MLSIRRSCVFILSLSLLLFFCLGTISRAQEAEPAKSTVSSTLVEGTWEVNGAAKITFTYKGQGKHHKIQHRSIVFSTTGAWTFNSDSTFSTIDHGIPINGTWTEKGKNVKVYFNIPEYQTLLEQVFADVGYPAIFSHSKFSATGTVNTSTLKAKLTIKSNAYFIDYGIGGTITATVHFVGSRIEPDAVVNADPESKSLIDAISEVAREGLTSPEE